MTAVVVYPLLLIIRLDLIPFRLDRGLGLGHVSLGPTVANVSTRTPVAGMPQPSSCPFRNRWSVAARMSGMAASRSPRRARRGSSAVKHACP